MEGIVGVKGRGHGQDEGVGSGTEVIGIGDRRGERLVKDMGMMAGDVKCLYMLKVSEDTLAYRLLWRLMTPPIMKN